MIAKKKPKSDAQVWEEVSAEAELDRIKHLSSDEVEREIRAQGGDPGAIGLRAAARAKELLAERALDWTARAKARAEETRRRAGEWPSFASLPRSELITRTRAAAIDARFSAPVVAAFRKRRPEEATDDELRALLEEVEVLRRLHAPNDDE